MVKEGWREAFGLKGVPVPLVVKLKAIALNLGKRLRDATDTTGGREEDDPEVPPATNFASGRAAPLTGVLPKVELTPTSTAQQQRFARQCTLQAVFDWYQSFLERDAAKDSPLDKGSSIEGGSRVQAGVPGFPQFTQQLIEAESDRVRVRFFDAGGREAGALVLRSNEDRCEIEVPGGPVYVARLTASLPDFTRDEDAHSSSTPGMTSTEKQRPTTGASPFQDAG